jgi:hypothetical protein
MMLAALRHSCSSVAGLRVHGFDAATVSHLLTDFDWVLPARKRPLAILIANGIELWPKFVQAYRASDALKASANPLDDWIEWTLTEILEPIAECTRVYYVHRRYDGKFVPMTRVAQASGYAAEAPCHLAVRSDVGPWLALRALALFDIEADSAIVAGATEPCASCNAPCIPAFERALASSGGPRQIEVAPNWKLWLSVRDSCPYGRNARYSAEQIEYHYTKRRDILDA